MKTLICSFPKPVPRAGLWRETLVQDLIDYALIGGFLAVSAGVFMPAAASKISAIFSKVIR